MAESRKSRRPSMADVARLAGVSQTTVSFILNNTPGSTIPQETRDRVLAAVSELGYRPNVSARNLRTQSTNLIGYGFEDPLGVTSHPILDRFIYSAILSLERAGYHLLTFVTGKRTDTEVYQELFQRGQVAGFVLANTNDNDPRISCLVKHHIPFASFGRSSTGWAFAWVDVDGASGMRQVVNHLTGRGHRRIGLLTWPEGSKAGSHREAGYFDGLAAADIDPDAAWLVRGENAVRAGAEGAARLLSLPEARRPTAIACVSDLIAVGAMSAATAAGLTVGREVAITGYDDGPLADFLQPPLTSVRQPITAVGRQIVDLLLPQLRGEPTPTGGVLLDPELIVRRSSDADGEAA